MNDAKNDLLQLARAMGYKGRSTREETLKRYIHKNGDKKQNKNKKQKSR